jgi:hypothetical protein
VKGEQLGLSGNLNKVEVDEGTCYAVDVVHKGEVTSQKQGNILHSRV